MNTIVRVEGHVHVVSTVTRTVKLLANKPGYIRITDIQTAINRQLPNEMEHFTHKMVLHTLVKILDKGREK